MSNEHFYIYIFIIMSVSSAGCFLCARHMETNRGNFVNLPAWRKATKSISDVLLGFTGICLLMYYKLYLQLMISLITPLLLTFVFYLTYIVYKYFFKKNSTDSVLGNSKNTKNIFLNSGIMEYVIYSVRYVSKIILFFFLVNIGFYKTVIILWNIEISSANSFFANFISLVDKIISVEFSVYLIGFCLALLFYSSIIMTVFSLTLYSEDAPINDNQRYCSIIRKFHFKEHSI